MISINRHIFFCSLNCRKYRWCLANAQKASQFSFLLQMLFCCINVACKQNIGMPKENCVGLRFQHRLQFFHLCFLFIVFKPKKHFFMLVVGKQRKTSQCQTHGMNWYINVRYVQWPAIHLQYIIFILKSSFCFFFKFM